MPTQASQKRWKQILQTIYEAIEDHGYPPTVREMGKSVGLSLPVRSRLTWRSCWRLA